MSKKIYLLLFFISMNLFAQHDKLNGKIKSIKEKIVYLDKQPEISENCLDCDPFSFYQFGIAIISNPKDFNIFFNSNWYTTSDANYKNIEQNFNEKGIKTEEIWFENDNSIKEKFEYTYDKNDSLTRIKESDSHGNFSIESINFLNNLRISKLLYSNISLNDYDNFQYENYVYDKNTKLIKKVIYDEKGYSSTYLFNHDSINKTIECWNQSETDLVNTISNNKYIIIDNSTITSLLWIKKYDDRNNIVEEIEHAFNENYESTFTRTETKYNENNKVIERNRIKKDYFISYFCEFDKNNDLIMIESKSKYPENDYQFQYFRKKNLITEVIIKRKKEILNITFTYNLDDKKNWVETTKSINGKPMFTIKRKIEYYD